MTDRVPRVNVQDPFLNMLRKDRVPVAVYLVNGIKLQGEIESFDHVVVLLRNDGGALRSTAGEREAPASVPREGGSGRPLYQMVFKHAISTVQPLRPVPSLYQTRPETARRPYGPPRGSRPGSDSGYSAPPDGDSYSPREEQSRPPREEQGRPPREEPSRPSRPGEEWGQGDAPYSDEEDFSRGNR